MSFLDWLRYRIGKPAPPRGPTRRVLKHDLARELIEEVGALRSVGDAVQVIDMLHIIMATHLAEGREVVIKGWGTYGTKRLPAYKGRKLGDGTRVKVPARFSPFWKVSRTLKRLIAQSG